MPRSVEMFSILNLLTNIFLNYTRIIAFPKRKKKTHTRVSKKDVIKYMKKQD